MKVRSAFEVIHAHCHAAHAVDAIKLVHPGSSTDSYAHYHARVSMSWAAVQGLEHALEIKRGAVDCHARLGGCKSLHRGTRPTWCCRGTFGHCDAAGAFEEGGGEIYGWFRGQGHVDERLGILERMFLASVAPLVETMVRALCSSSCPWP